MENFFRSLRKEKLLPELKTPTESSQQFVQRKLKEYEETHPDLRKAVERPNQQAVATLKNPPKAAWSNPNYDCSEIAVDIYKATGEKGMIVNMQPAKSASVGGQVTIPLSGSRIDTFDYHQVYSDGRYIFDPRLSSEPIPLADYIREIQSLNPGVLINTFTP